MLIYMDLMIGARVRITDNLCVAGGLYNGQMGTIKSFVYSGTAPQTPEQRYPKDFSVLTEEEREMPIVLACANRR